MSFFAQHLYFLSCLYFLFFWIVVFCLLYKDRQARKRMVIISVIFMAFNPFIQGMYLVDWWHPKFVFEQFHFEDLLFTFVITGFIAGLYSLLLRYKSKSITLVINMKQKILIAALSILIIFVSFYFLHLGSFMATILFMLFFCIVVFSKIPQRIPVAILVAFIVTTVAIPGYFYGTYLHPGWIQEYWILSGLPGKLVLGVPLGEYIFYFLDSLCTIAFYEFFFVKKI